jgi:hypothetical protein
MSRAGFEPAIPATKRPHTYALDHKASGTGSLEWAYIKFHFHYYLYTVCRIVTFSVIFLNAVHARPPVRRFSPNLTTELLRVNTPFSEELKGATARPSGVPLSYTPSSCKGIQPKISLFLRTLQVLTLRSAFRFL